MEVSSPKSIIRNIIVVAILLLSLPELNCCKSDGGEKHNTLTPSYINDTKIKKVNIYLDASASNKGYYSDTSDFKRKVTRLLTDLNTNGLFCDSNKGVTTEVFYISDEFIRSFGVGPNVVQKFIAESGVVDNTKGRSSTIDQFFDTLMKRTDSTTVSILISDCILSYPDTVLDKDKDRTKNKIDADNGVLREKTRLSIARLSNRNRKPAFGLYAYQSIFEGTYFNYKDFPLKGLKMKNRPFYIWILADNKNLLTKFEKQVMCDTVLKSIECMNFGLTADEYQVVDLLGKFKGGGTWSVDLKGRGFRNIISENGMKKPVFTVSVNLPELVNYDLAELNNKINEHCGSTNKTKYEVKFLDKKTLTAADKATLQTDVMERILENNSHLLQITVDQMVTEKDTLFIKMPFSYPTWYYKWSTHDDLTAKDKDIEGKTFALDQIIDAFIMTMQDDHKDIINIKIPISK